MLSPLTKLFRRIWHSETFPKDYSSPYTKKRDKNIRANCTGIIALIDISTDLFVKVLLNRFVTVQYSRTSCIQCGFSRGYSHRVKF